jgi:hypothetical protein
MIRAALSLMAGCVTAVGLYGLVRGIQFLAFREPNPATIIWSAHAGYFWRIWIVSYAGGMASILAWTFAGRDPARVARVLLGAVSVATGLIVLQGLLLP